MGVHGNFGADECLFELTLGHQQLGQHAFVSSMQMSNSEKQSVLHYLPNGAEPQTLESILRNPQELHIILRNAEMRPYFHFSNCTFIYNIYTCI